MNVQTGDALDGFRLLKRLGVGSFGQTFYARDEKKGTNFALKIELLDSNKRSLLNNEKLILQELKDSRYIPEFYGADFKQKFAYIVMDCLGPSVANVKGVFGDLTLSTALRVAVHMLLAIKDLHDHGYLHRDVKPSNFLVVPSKKTVVKMVDFGLSRKFLDDDGNIVHSNTGFAGTLKYASIQAHLRQEITQRDDLMSWFYSLIDLIVGKLPWSKVTNEKNILKIKQTISPLKLCDHCPQQFLKIYAYIKGLEEYEVPNYWLILSFLLDAIKENNIKWNQPYDWEFLTQKELKSISAISLDAPKESEPTPVIPKTLPAPILPEKYIKLLSEEIDSSKNVPNVHCFKCNIF